MSRKPRVLECPQCGEHIRSRAAHLCTACGYLLDMARISRAGALRHDRYEERQRRMEWVYIVLWFLVSAAWLGVVCMWRTQVICGLAAIAAGVQIVLGRLLILRRKRR